MSHCLSFQWLGSNPGFGKGFLPGWSHSANPSRVSVVETGSISSQRHNTTSGHQGGGPRSNDGQTEYYLSSVSWFCYSDGNVSKVLAARLAASFCRLQGLIDGSLLPLLLLLLPLLLLLTAVPTTTTATTTTTIATNHFATYYYFCYCYYY